MYVYMYVIMCICMCVFKYECVYVHMYVYMYACMHAYFVYSDVRMYISLQPKIMKRFMSWLKNNVDP